MNLKRTILEGENATIDFKKTINNCEKIAKTLVAFANNKGGKLLVGVADDGQIKGVKSEEEEKYVLDKAGQNYCHPTIDISYEEIYVDGKIVLVAEIKESDTKPHYALGEDKKWWVYIRVKDKSLLASKVVVDVLKRSNSDVGVHLEYSINEKKILEYLTDHDRITSAEYGKLMKLPRRKAQRILVNLVLSGIIRLHNTETEEYYTAS
ncbi:ATP-binding protein [Pedobacter sp. HMF7647]|uniref:ATP-binding protein n=1 Tax=Hufsiella arboris TaxID=2695275 RepID=A0A7K1Y8H2_9SPHI|nr:ATP-binding protein [Hufsiella arboris]MXV50671.1 ATP-binding protein [Hufsiella arboris]